MLKTLLAAAAILAASVAATPASAGGAHFSFGIYGPNGGFFFGDAPSRRILSESQIRRELRRDGWQDIDVEDRFGPNYRVEAEWYGQDYVLTVSAYTGDVLAYHPVGRPHFPPGPWAYR